MLSVNVEILTECCPIPVLPQLRQKAQSDCGGAAVGPWAEQPHIALCRCPPGCVRLTLRWAEGHKEKEWKVRGWNGERHLRVALKGEKEKQVTKKEIIHSVFIFQDILETDWGEHVTQKESYTQLTIPVMCNNMCNKLNLLIYLYIRGFEQQVAEWCVAGRWQHRVFYVGQLQTQRS